jgi:hypothetical protein
MTTPPVLAAGLFHALCYNEGMNFPPYESRVPRDNPVAPNTVAVDNADDRLIYKTAARVIAVGLAIGALPLGVVLTYGALLALPPTDAFLVLLPMGLVYAAVAWSAAGKRLWGDPFTTWIPWIAVDVLWLGFNHPYGFPEDREPVMYMYQATFILAAAIGGVFAIVFQIMAKPRRI